LAYNPAAALIWLQCSGYWQICLVGDAALIRGLTADEGGNFENLSPHHNNNYYYQFIYIIST
jgi:hypothetical protein